MTRNGRRRYQKRYVDNFQEYGRGGPSGQRRHCPQNQRPGPHSTSLGNRIENVRSAQGGQRSHITRNRRNQLLEDSISHNHELCILKNRRFKAYLLQLLEDSRQEIELWCPDDPDWMDWQPEDQHELSPTDMPPVSTDRGHGDGSFGSEDLESKSKFPTWNTPLELSTPSWNMTENLQPRHTTWGNGSSPIPLQTTWQGGNWSTRHHFVPNFNPAGLREENLESEPD